MRTSRRAVPILASATIASLLLTGSVSPSPTRLEAARQSIAAESSPRVVTIEVSLVAAIVESPTTIGVAESTLYNLSAQDLDKQLQVLKDAGVTDLRIAVPWVYIQPTSSTEYDWSKMDAVINAVSDAGFTVTASITGNPAWDGVPLAGAPNPEAYASFASATAERYAGKISAYEVWNEPNGALFYAPVNPEGYTEVLKAAYTAIKAADPDALVVGGVLGAVRTVPGVTLDPVVFLDRMYQAGASGYFDAISYHPYHYTMPFSQGLGEADSPLEQALALRALMIANGDEDLKLWATEYGVPTTPFFGLSQAQQAAFMADFISAWQNFDGAGPAFLYSGHDLSTGEWDNEANFGLFTSNWTPKQAVAVLSAMIADLEDGTLDNPIYAQRLPFAQSLFIQVASTALGLINTALIIPRAIGQAVYGLARQLVEAVVNTVKSVVSPTPKAAVQSETSTDEDTLTNAPEAANKRASVLAASDTAGPSVTEPDNELTAAKPVESVKPSIDTASVSAKEADSLAVDEGRDIRGESDTPEAEGTTSPETSKTEESSVESPKEEETSFSSPAPSAESPKSELAAESPKANDRETAREAKKAEREAKATERAEKRAEKAAAREATKAEREAQKSEKDAEKAERDAARDAKKAERDTDKDAKKSDSDSGSSNGASE